jgi:glycosyltransferase involved in cell wall biosynthesis
MHDRHASDPYVTVVIPTYRDWDNLRVCLEALSHQTVPADEFEVIVVNNDPGASCPFDLPARNMKLVAEARAGSYAARNHGLQIARGEIIAMIDSDCTPNPDWIEAGVRALETQKADLAGGKVTFEISPASTAAQMYDAVFNMQMALTIETAHTAQTANLFARRMVFDTIGKFPSDLRSGGDVVWTGKATGSGFKLIYAAEAEVFHPARRHPDLLKKQFRVGSGQPAIWRSQGSGMLSILLRILRGFLPLSKRAIKNTLRERGTPEMEKRFWQIWLIAWSCNVSSTLGRIRTLFSSRP